MFQRVLIYLAIITVTIITAGCGGSDSKAQGTSTPSTALERLRLIDAPIEGVTYICANGESHVTDDEGSIACDGFPITFKIGNIVIGELTQQGPDLFVTPQDLLGIARSELDNATLMRFIVFLQSLDDDGNYSDHITITTSFNEKMKNYAEVNFVDLNASKLEEIYSDLNITSVSESDAMSHLMSSLSEHIDTCNLLSDYNVTIAMNHSAVVTVYDTANDKNWSVDTPSHGTAQIHAVANEFLVASYTPDINFSGVDKFDYTIDDCTKQITVNVVSDVTEIPLEKREYGAAFFPNDSGTCTPLVTDGNNTFYTEHNISGACDYTNEGSFATWFQKVNNRFVYNANSVKIYAIDYSGQETLLNDDDISGIKAPFSQCPGDNAYMHQIQTLIAPPYSLVVGAQYPGDKEHLIYTALSPENTAAPDVDGMAAGLLPWMTLGYKKEFTYGSPNAGGSTGDGCLMSYYHTFKATFLMNDIAGDGVGSDKVVSPYVEMGGNVYYLTHYNSALSLDRIQPNEYDSLTFGFLWKKSLEGTPWERLTIDSESAYASFYYVSAIASDDKVYFYYQKDGENFIVQSDTTVDGTTTSATQLSEVTFQKIRVPVYTVYAGVGKVITGYRDEIYYHGYRNGVGEIGKIDTNGNFISIINNVPYGEWALLDSDNIYYSNENNAYSSALYHFDGNSTTMISTLGLGSDSSSDYSYIKEMKKIGERLYLLTSTTDSHANNLLVIDKDGVVKPIETGYERQNLGCTLSGCNTNFVGTQRLTLFSSGIGQDTLLYSTVDGNSTSGYIHKLKTYNVNSAAKSVIKTVVIP